MSDLIERIRADREAGTPGPWQVSGVRSTREIHGHQIDAKELAGVAVVTYSDATMQEHRGSLSDGRRIARVPEMESRILADAEALKAADALVDAIHNLADWQRYDATASHFPAEKPEVHECTDDARNALEAALTAYRKARGGE